MKSQEITLLDGKYSVINHNGMLPIYRHEGSSTARDRDLVGDDFVLALVQEIEELRECLEKLTGKKVEDVDPRC
jgi:hypothetical protein